jgi:deoxyribonuclease V
LPTAIRIILDSCRGYRIPEPIRQAHHYVNELRKGQGSDAYQLTFLA